MENKDTNKNKKEVKCKNCHYFTGISCCASKEFKPANHEDDGCEKFYESEIHLR